MKYILSFKIFLLLLFPVSLFAQVEKVIVETYYVSDANDATDTTGGGVEEGSTTYRIYIDLVPGSQLRKIYGDANHALKFASTASFFNNKADGQTFAKEFSKSRYADNTVALDTWITLGQTTRLSAKTYFGVLKAQDRDGSFIGGVNNDGGSAGIADGLLINSTAEMGIPVTTSDGMDTMTERPSSWADYGFIDGTSSVDSTIFGSVKTGSEFISNDAELQNSGVTGVIADSNQVLVAQLTTKGEISFELNVEVSDTGGNIIHYVASDSILLTGEVFNRFLKYPSAALACGCPDPNYLEYAANRDCDSQDSCRTLIVYGCMDITACNYDPDANFNIQTLCCYPGLCNDRDISVICPQLNYGKFKAPADFILYPNPAQSEISLQFLNDDVIETKYSIYNSIGELVMEKEIGAVAGSIVEWVDIGKLSKGLYMLRLFVGDASDGKIFVKD